MQVVQVVLWYLDSGYSKHTTGNLSKLKNFVSKFIWTVRFENDHFGAMMGYVDYVIGDSVISRVYYMEGLGHNLFFCKDVKLKNFVSKFIWTVRFENDHFGAMMGYGDYVIGDNLEVALRKRSCFVRDMKDVDLLKACQLGKSKEYFHKPKSKNTNMEVLHTLHMDLCGPMRVQSINGKKYILVIVDDYFRFSWVKFLRSEDETSEFVTKFLTQIQAEAVVTACNTQNRSLIHTRYNKTPYELVHEKKPDLLFL
nr:integrase, catalytic region, zinc finger, CCHC-type, peptidase aspartic, catalytic [Tanacetum cinerariifolium]